MRALICTTLFVAMTCVWAGEADAKARAAGLEKQLMGVADAKQRVALAQPYFAGLSSSADKIAALDMLDSRYVYFVPKELYPEILTRLIHDADLAVRARAARAIGYRGLGAKFPKELLELLKEEDPAIQKNALYAMSNGGDEFLAPIKAHLHSANPEIRGEAAFVYARWLGAEQQHYLELLKDDDPDLRIQAAETAVSMSHFSALAEVLKLLNDPSEQVRYRTVRALGGVDSATEAVAAKLSDVPSVRAAAVESLTQMQNRKKYVDTIGALLNDADENVRLAAIRALGELQAEKYVPQLTELRDEGKGLIQLRAKEALELMARLRPSMPEAKGE